MSLNLALTSAVSGLSTAQAGLDVISNNIANVNTEGYTRKQFVAESVVLAGKGAGVQIGDIINNVDQNLLRDLRKQHSAVGLLGTSNSYFKRIQDTFGTTASNSSISNRINRLQEEFTTLSTDPTSVSQQLSAVQAGRSAAENLAAMSETLQTLRLNADREIEGAVQQMGNLLANISALNDQISFNSASQRQTEDLEDKRDLALDKLSDLLDIRYFKNANGSVTVFTSDGTTLVDSSPVATSHVALSVVSPGATYAGGDFNGIFAGVRDITTTIRSGKIKGLVDMRDRTLPDMQAQLDELARSMQTEINKIHNRGTSYPTIVNNITGSRTFMSSADQTVRFSGAEPSIILYGTDGAEIASSRILDTTGVNFSNGGNIDSLASSMQTWIRAQDAQLTNATVSVNADGRFAINLGTDVIGVAFQDQESAIKGSAQLDVTAGVDLDGDGNIDQNYAGFSNFLGLNDYFVSTPNPSLWDSGFKPANYTLGIASARTLSFADETSPTGFTGGEIVVNPGDSLQQIADRINANTDLQGRIEAEVVPEGSGERLRIRHILGEQLVVTQDAPTAASFAGVAVTYQAPQTIGGTSVTQIDGAAGDFVTSTLDETDFGDLTFANVGGGSTVTAATAGAFADYKIGDTIMINGSAIAQGGALDNNGVYTITALSADGSTITLDQNVTAPGAEPAASSAVEIHLVAASGSSIALSGSAAGNNGNYTVKWPTNAQLVGAGFTLNGAAPDIVDGDAMFVSPNVLSTAGETITLSTFTQNNDAITALGLKFSSNGISQNLAVKQTLIDDASRISRGTVQLDPLDGTYLLAEGDNTIASQMAALLSGKTAFNPAGSLSGTTVSFSDYAASIISRNSTEAAAAQTNLKLQEDLKGALDLKSAQASGVNLDEEMSNLIIFQQTYAASAKVISTTQQMFDILNNIIR